MVREARSRSSAVRRLASAAANCAAPSLRTQVGRDRSGGRIVEQRDFVLSRSLPQVRGQRGHVSMLLESEVGEQSAGDRVRQRLMPRALGHVVHPGILAAIRGTPAPGEQRHCIAGECI